MRVIKYSYFKNKETIHNFIWRSLQVFGKQGITFLIFVLVAKLLIPYEFGIYNYVLAVIFFLIMLGDFGISVATSKYVAEYNATNKEKLKSVLFNAGLIIFSLALIITFLTLIIGPSYLEEKYIYILYLLPLIFLAPMTSLYDGIYRGLKRFKQLAIISLVIGFVSLSSIYFLIKSYGLIGALIAQILFYFLLFLALAFGYKDFTFKINKIVMKEVGKYSFLVGLATLGYFLYTRIDLIILGHFNFIEQIGYYEIINKIIMILLLPITIFATVVAPNTTKKYSLKKYSLLFNKMKKEILYLFILGIFVSFISYFGLITLFEIFLPEYNLNLLAQILGLILIILPLKFYSGYLSVAYIVSTGHAKISTYTLVIFGFLNIIFTIWFIYLFGFIGVIYATILCHSLQILTKTGVYYYLLKGMVGNEKI